MKFSPYLLGVALSAVTLLTACHAGHNHGEDEHAEADDHGHEHATDEITLTPAQAKAGGVEVAAVQPADFAEVVSVTGRLLPAQGAEATVTATMAGIVRLAATSLTDGAAVRAGQTLFTVNAQSMADGNPAAAAQAELTAARAALARAEQLAAGQVISQRELEDARQRCATAEAAARSLGSAAQTRAIAAPIGGYVKNLLVKPGDYVSAGQALATVTQSRRVQLRADVPERYYHLLPHLVSANFRMAYDESGRVHSLSQLGGRLVSRGRSADADGFFVPVTFEFDNVGDLVSGSYAEVWLLGRPRSGVLAVPTEALTEAQGLHFVYVQTHPDAYRRQEVRLGATDGSRTEVVSGLKPGDRVVVKGATTVRLAASASVVPEGHSH